MKVKAPGAVSPRARHQARRTAIEREQSRYISLACGHYTSRERIELYSFWQPRRGTYFCETCGRWVKKRAEHSKVPLPDIPLF